MITECMTNIMSFLDKNSLKSIVVSSGKKNQDVIKESLSRLRVPHINICKWTHKYKIENVTSYVMDTNIKYISNICKKLFISKDRLRKNAFIKIYNDNIEYLHIDWCQIHEIRSKSLKILFLIYNKNLNVDILENIILNCQNLNKIFIYSKFLLLDNDWIYKMQNYNKKLIINNFLSMI